MGFLLKTGLPEAALLSCLGVLHEDSEIVSRLDIKKNEKKVPSPIRTGVGYWVREKIYGLPCELGEYPSSSELFFRFSLRHVCQIAS